MINEKLWHQIQTHNTYETLAGGAFGNSKLTLYVSVSSPRRPGIFKYSITPHSFTEKRLSSFYLETYGKTDKNDPYTNGKEYDFIFESYRKNLEIFFADSIEELCNQLDIISTDYDDKVICFSKLCPDVPINGKAEGSLKNKSGE